MISYKKDAGFVQELRDKEQSRIEKVQMVIEEARDILSTQKHIWRSQQVSDQVKMRRKTHVSMHFVGEVLRKCMHMRYKKVKRVPFQGNSARCLVLR